MNDLNAKLKNVRARIEHAAKNAGRPAGAVELLAVSKGQPAEAIRQLCAAGQRKFGENYLQEAAKKQDSLQDCLIEWHFIGPLQSNKTAEVANRFDWVQSADREKILRRLSAQRPAGMAPLKICLQVNIDREPQKSGADPEAIMKLAELTSRLPHLCLRGLMAIPRPAADGGAESASLEKTADLYQRIKQRFPEVDTLSLGMSADLEAAVQAGSTLVRVGTDLFGPRR